MRYIVLLMVIVVWWFSIIIGTDFLLDDTLLLSSDITGNRTLTNPNTDGLNFSSSTGTDDVSTDINTFETTMQILFGFTVPDGFGIPKLLVRIISVINWLVLVLTGVTIYKLVNFLSSG